MQLPCVIIRDIIFLPGFLPTLVCTGFKGLNFNLKQTKLSKNPGKNIMSRIFTQGSCINRYYAVLDGF